MKNKFTYPLFLGVLILQFACAPMMKQPMQTSEARLGANSKVSSETDLLPEPSEPVVVAVYKFRDQTGQYKPSEIGANWSTAVTQGATSILLESLEESGWFMPIEREGLSNLLNERKIIRSSRAAFNAQDPNQEQTQLLPPMLFAGIILEGGIISYESNVMTGGAGLRYFGAGANGQYREDRVSIYLRAISTSNGRILKSVHTSKTILSQKLDAGIFRYVSLKRLLEAEVGFTFNEPAGIAVQEAIDKAVHALIIEGIMDDLWQVKDSEDLSTRAIANYLEEKEENEQTDYLGFQSLPYRSRFKLGLAGGTMTYDGDYPRGALGPMGEFSLGFFQNSSFSFDVGIGVGKLATRDNYSTYVQHSRLNLKYRMMNDYRSTPYIEAGGGFLLNLGENPFGEQPEGTTLSNNGFANAAIGFEFMLSQKTGLDINAGYYWLFNDNVDQVAQGRYNDFYWTVKLGINFYLGK
jgi:curli production assembly/transport component CsgG